jgi:hypothetical protein
MRLACGKPVRIRGVVCAQKRLRGRRSNSSHIRPHGDPQTLHRNAHQQVVAPTRFFDLSNDFGQVLVVIGLKEYEWF